MYSHVIPHRYMHHPCGCCMRPILRCIGMACCRCPGTAIAIECCAHLVVANNLPGAAVARVRHRPTCPRRSGGHRGMGGPGPPCTVV